MKSLNWDQLSEGSEITVLDSRDEWQAISGAIRRKPGRQLAVRWQKNKDGIGWHKEVYWKLVW